MKESGTAKAIATLDRQLLRTYDPTQTTGESCLVEAVFEATA